jgi:hypothetical protein
MHVLSREGLTIGLEISALYRLGPDSAANVYRKIGTDYPDVVLVPQFRSVSRAVTASFQASALYSTEREELGSNIQTELAALVRPRGITIESTPLRNVALPTQLTEAIEQKQRAEQESQRMEFILMKEKQEADRKRIEAKGIADFQAIVAAGISEQLLRGKGIEAIEKLASSPNTKVIIVGAGMSPGGRASAGQPGCIASSTINAWRVSPRRRGSSIAEGSVSVRCSPTFRCTPCKSCTRRSCTSTTCWSPSSTVRHGRGTRGTLPWIPQDTPSSSSTE